MARVLWQPPTANRQPPTANRQPATGNPPTASFSPEPAAAFAAKASRGPVLRSQRARPARRTVPAAGAGHGRGGQHRLLGYEYVFDAADGNSGVYFYDFASNDFFYTSPGFPFPYLYDFGLNSTVYYYPDPNHPGHYNTNGVRYFYVFNTGQIISK